MSLILTGSISLDSAFKDDNIRFLCDSTYTCNKKWRNFPSKNLPMQSVRNPQILRRGLASLGEALPVLVFLVLY
jgi:hypothetical protein